MELLKIKMLNTAVERIMNRALGELNLRSGHDNRVSYGKLREGRLPKRYRVQPRT